MNHAPTPNQASCPAIGGRMLARAQRVGAAACVAVAVVCAPAYAQRNGDQRQDQHAQQDPRMAQQRAPDQPQPRFDPRTFDSRQDPRVQDPSVRGQEQHHPNAAPSRMTPDERRDLRRQINEAGMDLYTRPPRR